MSSQTSEKQGTTAEFKPIKAMQGHTDDVRGVVHLHGGRRIITCSWDGSLRLWDLESGTQIGEDWKDKEKKAGVYSIALSPNGKTVVTGSSDRKVKLWNVETGKVIQRWTGHTGSVTSVSWSADGDRVVSGSRDGTARVWNAKTGETILEIRTGHKSVWAVKYSPDNKQIATGGSKEDAAKIWDAKTGELIATLEHDKYTIVFSWAWTSDGKKLITASRGPMRIFDTATWEQIATLEGHETWVNAISLSPNNRLLASASDDNTARIWNLGTNLPVGPPLKHRDRVDCAAFSANGRVLVTGSKDKNACAWDVYAILKQAGLEDLLQSPSDVPARKSLKGNGATRLPPIQARRIPPGFFDGVQNSSQSSTAHATHTHSSAYHPRRALAPSSADLHALLNRISSFFHHSRSDTDAATELQQRPTRPIFSRGPRVVEVAAVQDRKLLLPSRFDVHTLPVLLHQVQHPSPFHGGLMSYFFSAAHLLARQLKHSSSSNKAKRTARSRPKDLHHSLPLPQRPWHLLLLLALPHQMQQPYSRNHFHCALALFFSSAVLLQRTLTVINTVPHGLFRICVLFFFTLIFFFLSFATSSILLSDLHRTR
ncbi:WD40-repeat-containing domain protein [Suillus occidentalis]|nr:WD40-repeat-containing domain protein [Suillus occidentalis]